MKQGRLIPICLVLLLTLLKLPSSKALSDSLHSCTVTSSALHKAHSLAHSSLELCTRLSPQSPHQSHNLARSPQSPRFRELFSLQNTLASTMKQHCSVQTQALERKATLHRKELDILLLEQEKTQGNLKACRAKNFNQKALDKCQSDQVELKKKILVCKSETVTGSKMGLIKELQSIETNITHLLKRIELANDQNTKLLEQRTSLSTLNAGLEEQQKRLSHRLNDIQESIQLLEVAVANSTSVCYQEFTEGFEKKLPPKEIQKLASRVNMLKQQSTELSPCCVHIPEKDTLLTLLKLTECANGNLAEQEDNDLQDRVEMRMQSLHERVVDRLSYMPGDSRENKGGAVGEGNRFYGKLKKKKY